MEPINPVLPVIKTDLFANSDCQLKRFTNDEISSFNTLFIRVQKYTIIGNIQKWIVNNPQVCFNNL